MASTGMRTVKASPWIRMCLPVVFTSNYVNHHGFALNVQMAAILVQAKTALSVLAKPTTLLPPSGNSKLSTQLSLYTLYYYQGIKNKLYIIKEPSPRRLRKQKKENNRKILIWCKSHLPGTFNIRNSSFSSSKRYTTWYHQVARSYSKSMLVN